MVVVTDFIFLDSKITVDSECSLEIKRRLLLGKKTDKPRQRVKTQTRYFADKSPSDEALVFLVVLYGCEVDHKEG